MYNIMIVDDEDIICDGLMSFDWESYGFKAVCSASDGAEALSLMKNLKIDVIITDIKMPVMDGLDLCMHINRMYPTCKIVLLSGYKEFEYAKTAISLGVSEYLLKPVDMNELTGLLKKLKKQLDREHGVNDMNEGLVPGEKSDGIGQHQNFTDVKYSFAVQKTIDYIRKHYPEKLTLHDVAENVQLSEGYLCARFSRETGKGFLEFLNEVRIEQAKILLKQTNLKVYEIAEKVGYSNTKYFTDVFKKITGMTPLKFKES